MKNQYFTPQGWIECVKLSLRTQYSVNLILSFSLQEHTLCVDAVQFDDFQIISGSRHGTILIHDFLDPTPPILRT